MIVVEEERNGEVAGAFEHEVVVVRHLDGVDVGEGGVVAEHFDVDEADDVLLHLPLGDVRLGETSFQGFDLVEDDAFFFGLGSSFADGLD